MSVRRTELTSEEFEHAKKSGDEIVFKNRLIIGAISIGEDFRKFSFINCIFQEVQIHDSDLSGVDFTGSAFLMGTIKNCAMSNAKFSNTVFLGTEIKDSNAIAATFTRSYWSGVNFRSVKMMYAIVNDALIVKSNIVRCSMGAINLTGSVLKRVNLFGSRLSTATIHGASFETVWAGKCNLNFISLKDTYIWDLHTEESSLDGVCCLGELKPMAVPYQQDFLQKLEFAQGENPVDCIIAIAGEEGEQLAKRIGNRATAARMILWHQDSFSVVKTDFDALGELLDDMDFKARFGAIAKMERERIQASMSWADA